MELLVLLGRAALVFGLLALTLWLVRRTDGGRRLQRAAGPLEVVSSTRLGKGASLALVRIGATTYALGVTEHAVSLLTETDLEPVPAPAPVPPAQPGATGRPGFAAALQEQTALLLRRGAPAAQPDTTGTAATGTAAPDRAATDGAAASPPTDAPAAGAPTTGTAATVATVATGAPGAPVATVAPGRPADAPAAGTPTTGAPTTPRTTPRTTSRRTSRTTSHATTADGSAAGTITAGTAPAATSAPVRTDAPTDPVQERPCPPIRPHRRPPVARGGRVGS